MSLRATSWAWKVIQNCELNMAAKVVLLVLADRHFQETGRCNPSIASIMQWTGIPRRTVQRALKELCDKKVISIIYRRRRDGSKRHDLPNEYKFLRAVARSWATHQGGDMVSPPRVSPCRPLRANLAQERPSHVFDLVIDADGYVDSADARPRQDDDEWGEFDA